MSRLLEVCSGGMSSTPTPSGSKQITSITQLLTRMEWKSTPADSTPILI